MKNPMRRLTAVLLACAALLSLTGCAAPWLALRGAAELVQRYADSAPSSSAETTPDLTARYFDDVWRADTAYADMTDVGFAMDDFQTHIDGIYELVREGGTQEEFEQEHDALLDGLYALNTLAEMRDLAYCADPTDADAAAEYTRTQDDCDTANDDFWTAMGALAASPYADLLAEDYADWQISGFLAYQPSDDASAALLSRETALEQEYYALMAEDAPDEQAVGELYVSLVSLRNQEAALWGYDSYADYAYAELYARDYGPADSEAVWETAKARFVPLLSRYANTVYNASAALSDADCSPDAILDAMARCLPQLSPELTQAFDYMREYGLYDIGQDDSKVSTGFTTRLYWYNEPFVFNCPSGSFYDYTDTFHEFGHFANMLNTWSDLLFGLADNDLAELQAQGMEVLFTQYYDDIFGTLAAPARAAVLLSLVYAVVDGAMLDEFQQRVYAEEDLTPQRVNAIYAEVFEEYGYEPYDGYETEWMYVEHNFGYPFYYLSYAVSALSALDIYALCGTDFAAAADTFMQLEAMDGEAWYFSEAIAEVGLPDVFAADAGENAASAAEACFAAA